MKKINRKTTKQIKKKLTKRLVVFVMFITLLTLALMSPKENFIKITARKLFSGNNPVSSVDITTDDYDNEGSIKITKEAHWTSKTEAELNIKLDTIRKTGDNKKDIVLVFDVSGSMEGEKLERVKQDASELIEYVLDKDEDNKVGLITFASQSRIISPLTNDKSILLEAINNMHTEDATNYYLAYKDIETILEGYSKESGKDLVVLFMTDGVPTDGSSAQGVYESLKEQYPYITINAIEYVMGDTTSSVNNISDGQWTAKIDSLNNVLFEATVSPESYEKLSITDYINNNYFEIEGVSNSATINGNKIEWKYNDNSYITGREDKLKVKLKLKEQYQNTKGLYPTNTKLDIEYKLSGNSKLKSSTNTPILKNNYDVYYDTNAPEGCTLDEIESENHFIYDNVTKKDTTLSCTGYEFKGWEILEKNVSLINDETFIMPESDIHIRAIWTRQSVEKSMDGHINEKTTLYKVVENDAKLGIYATKYNGEHQDSLNAHDDYNVYYYNQKNSQNNVIFANYCWQIVRTTDTGGTKLLYNGPKSGDDRCLNYGASIAWIKYGYSSSLAYSGYMYNTVYSYKTNNMSPQTIVLNRTSLNKTHYFAKDYEYNESVTNKYKLYNNSDTDEDERFTAEECMENNDCNNQLIGTYTFSSNNAELTGTTIRYVVGIVGEYLYYLELKNGQNLDDSNSMFYVGNGYIDNGDGTYTIKNADDSQVITYKKEYWFDKYSESKNKYICMGSNPCNNLMYITSTTIQNFNAENVANNYLYGNDFDYTLNEESGEYEYRLKDTNLANKVQFWDWHNKYNQINNNHYTCFNSRGICKEINYIYYTTPSTAFFITIKDGKTVDNAIDEMLNSNNLNTTNSIIKTTVDNWYENNLNNYENYLEDTIWCNDRNIKKLGGWDPNGGELFSPLEFNVANSLICQNEKDSFMKSNSKAQLTYPIGLITNYEALIAANSWNSSNVDWWLNSPLSFSLRANSETIIYFAYYDHRGIVRNQSAHDAISVRPAVSLKAGTEYIDGDGSMNNPYIVDTSEVDNP